MDKKRFPGLIPDLLLLVSSLGALALFLVPSTIVTLMLAAIFCLLVFTLVLDRREHSFSPDGLLLAISFSVIGFLLFSENMAVPLSHVGDALGLTPIAFSRLLAAALCLWGFYAFYRLGEKLRQLLGGDRCLRPVNLLLTLSAAAFFLLEPERPLELICSWIAALSLLSVFLIHRPVFYAGLGQDSPWMLVYAGASALGILTFRSAALPGLPGVLLGIVGLPFVFFSMMAFLRWLSGSFRELGTFREIDRREWLFYGSLLLAALLFITLVFTATDAFYGTVHPFDVIYTSDSPELVRENAYLDLYHGQNDLRQPLFAVFAAPFLGIPQLISFLTGGSFPLTALVMDYFQAGLLLLTNLLLARLLELNRRKRMLFMICSLLTYPVLLFLLMMEQYVVAYFYLILTLSLILAKNRRSHQAICGAGGTLLTGMILLPALGEHSPLRQFRTWYREMLDRALEFLLVLLVFGRLDILLDAASTLIMMMTFTGRALTLGEKLFQYSGFFRFAFLAPAAEVRLTPFPSWQLTPALELSPVGLGILGLALLGLLCCRKDRAVRASGLWLGFSFLVLFVLGWGTQENGLILYSLYFSWALWVPIWRLGEALSRKWPRLGLPLGLAAIAGLALVNLPAMGRLIDFALTYYPV